MPEIFIPFWGDPGYLREAVESVRAQTDPEWRLVVVDDCYPDAAVADWFAALDDPRVSYLRNETNLGITGNYRRCLELAGGEWMVFLGCDDLLLPAYVATVRAAIASAEPASTSSSPVSGWSTSTAAPPGPLVDRVKRRLFRPRVTGRLTLGGEDLAVSLLRGNWTYWPSLAFRIEAVRAQTFLDGFPLVQDLALMVDMALDGSRMLVLADEVFAYRRHSASASSPTVSDGGRFGGERDYFEIAARRCADAVGRVPPALPGRTRRRASTPRASCRARSGRGRGAPYAP